LHKSRHISPPIGDFMQKASHTEQSVNLEPLRAEKSGALCGVAPVPGDKSISHRALMLSAIMKGSATIHGLLEGEDVLRTADALRACGVTITRDAKGIWHTNGVGIGGLREPTNILDMGNSGTAARLMMGLLAPYPFTSHFTGDESLRSRPMKRVMAPLEAMGVHFSASEGSTLPLAMEGAANLNAIHYRLPVASAQVKSAIMLAALNTAGTTHIIEPIATRDHTERMLRFLEIPVEVYAQENETHIQLTGHPFQNKKNIDIHVPADPSSAAFLVVAALIIPGSQLTLPNVCLNPLRTGLLDTLLEMGAGITISNQRESCGEPVGDLCVKHSTLHGVEVPAHRAPSMIDEYPILAVAAAFAKGRTTMHGLAELRVKESNRFAAIMAGLNACGIDTLEDGDTLIVSGKAGMVEGGGTVTTHFDHRIAMSFLVLGMASQHAVTVDDGRAIATSFPNFIPLMQSLGASLRADGGQRLAKRLVIAVDGPAASGKGTLARRLADHFGLAYMDTGSLYRATGMRVLYANKEPHDVAAAIAAAKAVQEHDLANPKIRSERMGQAASVVSAIPEVREILRERQQHFAAKPEGAVLDGRDIGTVICPNANVKFFITASLEARAKRRHRQLQEYGIQVSYESVHADLAERDARDAARSVAPLKPANNAVVLDTSSLSANEAFTKALEVVENVVSLQ
jgi:3-phosphoshikimate 1-carboxyvinyltransferase